MPYQLVRLELGRITRLTFSDPGKANVMSPDMAPEFAAAVQEIKAHAETRVVILTGEGKAFSGGGHLGMIEELGRHSWSRNREYMLDFYKKYMSLLELDVPVVAAINGAAVGAGLLVAMTADLRVAADDAKMGVNFVKLGLHPGLGGTFTLPFLLGYARAAELLYTGKLITGAEAAAMGLVNKAVPRDEVSAAAEALAGEIAANAPLTMRALKRNLRSRLFRELQLVLDDESAAQAAAGAELEEGIKAAKERRPAEF